MKKILTKIREALEDYLFSDKLVTKAFKRWASDEIFTVFETVQVKIEKMGVVTINENEAYYKTSANMFLHSCALKLKAKDNVRAISDFKKYLDYRLRALAFDESIVNIRAGVGEVSPKTTLIHNEALADFEHALLKIEINQNIPVKKSNINVL